MGTKLLDFIYTTKGKQGQKVQPLEFQAHIYMNKKQTSDYWETGLSSCVMCHYLCMLSCTMQHKSIKNKK